MKIKIDIREKKLIPLLKALNSDYGYNIEINVERLDLGDIIIYDIDGDGNVKEHIIIERKSLSDLASSIRDGRYMEQAYRLDKETLHNHNIIYLIEGDLGYYSSKYTKIKKETLLVTMGCIQYYKGFSVIRTKDLMETAEYIIRFTDKLIRDNKKKEKKSYYEGGRQMENYSNFVSRVKKNNVTPENIGEIILNQIPGISKSTSLSIMEHYGSLYNLLNQLKKSPTCLDNLKYKTKNGQERRISKTSIRNISQYLLYQKTNIIKVET
jgi:ERCC4-type nuclease